MFNFALNLIQTYPGLCAAILGITFPILFSTGLELVWFPKDWDGNDRWRAISLVDFFGGFGFTHALWHGFSPDTHSRFFISVISLGVATSVVMVHMIGLAIIKKKLPWLDVDLTPPTSK